MLDVVIKVLFIFVGLPLVVFGVAYVFDKIFDYPLKSTFLDDLNNEK